jgi:hypothetical protein
MEPLAQGSTDPDGYGCKRMHDETVLDKMKQSIKISDEQLKDLFDVKEYPLDDKGMYDGFEKPFGKNFRPEWIPREDTWWWVEDLVLDLLKKEKVFGDRQIIPTRHLTGKKIDSQKLYFKGPLSKMDFWIPGYAFIEVKYTGKSERGQWWQGYEIKNGAINSLCSLDQIHTHYSSDLWKNNKLFLIVVHTPELGDRVSVSIIDVLDKCEFPYSHDEKTDKINLHGNLLSVFISVDKENCMKRVDNVPYRAYRKRCHEAQR